MNGERSFPQRLARPAPIVAAAVALPALAAALRAGAQRWQATLDNGIYSARAWDVGTSHNPMLATWSSRSTATGVVMNHPGPLPFQLLAPFRRLLGPVGTRVGSGLINAGALGSAAWLAWRVGRRRGAVCFGLGGLVLAASMGSEVLSDPWTHNLPLLAFFAAMVGLWASLAGDRWGPMVSVCWTSLCAQTSLAYVVPGAVVVVASLVAGGLWWWLARRTGSAPHGAPRDRLIGLGAAGAALLAMWALPAWEQWVAPDGEPGNLTAMIENSRRLGTGRGLSFAVRSFSDLVLVPPGWVFPDLATWENNAGARLGVGASWAVFACFVVALIAAGAWARRRRSIVLGSAVAAVVLVTVASVGTLASISETTLATAAYLRWLFAVGAFVASALGLVVLDAALSLLPGTERVPQLARSGMGLAVAAAAVVGLATFAVDTHGLESGSPPWANEPAAELPDLLDGVPAQLADRGPLLAVETPYTTSLVLFPAVLDELLAGGTDLRFASDSPLLAQFGTGRRATGVERWELSTRSGVAAYGAQDEVGVELLATTGMGDEADFDDLTARAEAIALNLNDSTLVFQPGRSRTPEGRYFDAASVARVADNPESALFNGTASLLVRRNLVDLPNGVAADIEAFAADVDRRNHAFAVVLQPIGHVPPEDQGPVLALPGGARDRQANPLGTTTGAP
ncbi:MAG: hypothetical protein R2754_16480 [Microthrixaceae bacterium]